jgi:hypothetical protein
MAKNPKTVVLSDAEKRDVRDYFVSKPEQRFPSSDKPKIKR